MHVTASTNTRSVRNMMHLLWYFVLFENVGQTFVSAAFRQARKPAPQPTVQSLFLGDNLGMDGQVVFRQGALQNQVSRLVSRHRRGEAKVAPCHGLD